MTIIDKKCTDNKLENTNLYIGEGSEFIANISHELNTPLNLFYSSIQLLDKFIEKEDIDFRLTYKKYNRILHKNCERMIRLVSNITDLIKVDRGILSADFKNYNIVSIVEDVTMAVAEYSSLKNINIKFDTDKEEQIIKCDGAMIERSILNLLSNSIKFSNKNSNINVNIFVNEEWVDIEVKDNGIGISKENQSVIFDKFVQLDKSFTRQNEGSGIGLSIVQSLINIHDGIINVESKINKGSSFKLLLPNKYMKAKGLDVYEIDNYKVRIELSDIYDIR